MNTGTRIHEVWNFFYPLCPLPVAEQMVTFAPMVRVASAGRVAFEPSTAQRQDILRTAFVGQLVPQDPNDEPASVLLERLRAEQGARATLQQPRARQARETA